MDGRASILPEWWELICFNIINTLVVDGRTSLPRYKEYLNT